MVHRVRYNYSPWYGHGRLSHNPQNLLLKRLIQRIQQLDRFLEPAVLRAFCEPPHAEVALLPYLTVIRDVILVFLEQDLGKQAGVSDTLVDRYQRHWSDLHALLFLGWDQSCS